MFYTQEFVNYIIEQLDNTAFLQQQQCLEDRR